MGVLKKDGRRIVSERNSRKGQRSDSGRFEELENLRLKVQSKMMAIEEKKRILKEAQAKRKYIEYLMKRNQREQYGEKVIIPFPFIGMLLPLNSVEVTTILFQKFKQ